MYVCDHNSQYNIITLLKNDLSNPNNTWEPITNHGIYHRAIETKKFEFVSPHVQFNVYTHIFLDLVV